MKNLTRHPKDQYYVNEDGHWMHKSPIKLWLNPKLRKLQWWDDRPWVIASKTEWIDGVPHFKGYSFQKVQYRNFKED